MSQPSELTKEQIENLTKDIQEMSHHEMCRIWRHGNSDCPYFQPPLYEIYRERLFDHFGGFTPEISKSIGW